MIEPQPPSKLRVLLVILSLDREPWRSLERAQRETWARPRVGVEIVYLQGRVGGPLRGAILATRKLMGWFGVHRLVDRVVGRITVRLPVRCTEGVVRTSTPEYWIGTSAKVHAGLKYLADQREFDYLVRTNSSTYVNVPLLLDYLNQAPRERFYAGADQGEPHAQGTCIVLSSDVVEAMAKDGSWAYDDVDDRAIGESASRQGLVCHLFDQEVLPPAENIDALPVSTFATRMVMRTKTRGDRENDRRALIAVHARVVEAGQR